MKKYRVMIELDTFETTVSAINKAEAKKKAIDKLRKKDISTMIRNLMVIDEVEQEAPAMVVIS